MSRMFKSITRTWNVFVGCYFDCTFCNARKAALTRFKHTERYKDGFKPHLVESELNRSFKPGEFIFVAYMGDISWASREEMNRILSRINQFPLTDFLLQTKDPRCFHDWHLDFPPNVVLGTIMETNRNYRLTKAPPPYQRYEALASFEHPRKFLSIEPVMGFDLAHFIGWIEKVQPDIIEVGADNYHNNLPEPLPEELEHLIRYLRDICPTVIEKEGMERLT